MNETRATLSVAIITFNEEANIARTLASVQAIADEIVVVDSHSTDRTVEIAKEFGAKVFVEDWKGFAAQKNSALDKSACDWILSLDADEEVSRELVDSLIKFKLAIAKHDGLGLEDLTLHDHIVGDLGLRGGLDSYTGYTGAPPERVNALELTRVNLFLNNELRRGGLYPDPKLRVFRRTINSRFQQRSVHEDIVKPAGVIGRMKGDLIHHQYPALTSYIDHMNRYSSLGAEMVVEKRGRVGFSVINIVVRPIATFIYNYFFRLGFLDGKEGLLLHLYHSVYVSWKYAKAWEASRQRLPVSGQKER